MKLNELRIGNYLKWESSINNNGIGCVEFINSRCDSHFMKTFQLDSGATSEQCKPIPLTKEWLLRFGFKQNAIGFWWRKHPNPKSKDNWDGWYLNKDGELSISLGPIFIRIQYVHQLQNLYFALTGEELTIKE